MRSLFTSTAELVRTSLGLIPWGHSKMTIPMESEAEGLEEGAQGRPIR